MKKRAIQAAISQVKEKLKRNRFSEAVGVRAEAFAEEKGVGDVVPRKGISGMVEFDDPSEMVDAGGGRGKIHEEEEIRVE